MVGDKNSGKKSLLRLFKRDKNEKKYDFYSYDDRNEEGVQVYLVDGRDNWRLIENVVTEDNYEQLVVVVVVDLTKDVVD